MIKQNLTLSKRKRLSRPQLEKRLLHHTGKAISDFDMIRTGDRVLVCVSGGKDSITMITLLKKLQLKAKSKFELKVLTLDQGQPGWYDEALKAYLTSIHVDYEVLYRNTYKIVKEKLPEGKTYCSLCSRLRRGIIYRYAKDHGFNKIALGHHRDDLVESVLMSMFYKGEIASMPPKLQSDSGEHIVIRPLVYCPERDIQSYSDLSNFPIIPCNLCGSQPNLARAKMKTWLKSLEKENEHISRNVLASLSHVRPSQLMDDDLWDFKSLHVYQEGQYIRENSTETVDFIDAK